MVCKDSVCKMNDQISQHFSISDGKIGSRFSAYLQFVTRGQAGPGTTAYIERTTCPMNKQKCVTLSAARLHRTDGPYGTDEQSSSMELNLDLKLIFAILNGKVSAAIYRKLQRHFSDAGLNLTPEQWTVLLYLSEQDGVSQQHLCQATYKEKPAMSHLVDCMEENGLVRRYVNPNDRRSNLVHLTPRGHLVKSRAQKVAIHTLKEALRGLGEEALVISQEVLRQIFENTTSDSGNVEKGKKAASSRK